MVNNNNHNDDKKIQIMHNVIAHHPLTDARLPFPNPDWLRLPGNSPCLYRGYGILWWKISH